jgi:hypothetical protein
MSSVVEEPTVTTISNKERRPSIMDIIREKQNDQDFNQKLNVGITLILEIYRVLMGAFLVVFVPQKCADTICSASENINRDDALSQTAISFNLLTALSFLALYFVEVKRENKMISYLEVNKFTPTDNDAVGVALEKLATGKKEVIWDYDRYYQKSGYVSTVAFTLNAILSFIVVYNNYLDSKTITVFLTNILLMGLKVADVFSTVNTPKNIFYSAYLKNKVQYNDVDPDKIKTETEDKEEVRVEEIVEPSQLNTTVDIDQTESQTQNVELDTATASTPLLDANSSPSVSIDSNDSNDSNVSTEANEIFKDSHKGEQPNEVQADASDDKDEPADNSV